MGFGWMFIGYVFLLTARYNGFDVLPDIVGFSVMLYGFSFASKHCARFNTSYLFCRFGILLSAVYLVFMLLDTFKTGYVSEMAIAVINFVYTAFIVAFNVFYLLSLKNIAFDTDVRAIKRRSATGILLAFVALLPGRALQIIGGRLPDMPEWMYPFGLLLEILFCIYVLITTFNCYMKICLEGDEDMPDTSKHKYPNPFDMIEKGKNVRGGKRK